MVSFDHRDEGTTNATWLDSDAWRETPRLSLDGVTLLVVVAAHPDDGEYALDLLMIAKYFERIGDHATNIAEWVIFSVTGVHKEG